MALIFFCIHPYTWGNHPIWLIFFLTTKKALELLAEPAFRWPPQLSGSLPRSKSSKTSDWSRSAIIGSVEFFVCNFSNKFSAVTKKYSTLFFFLQLYLPKWLNLLISVVLLMTFSMFFFGEAFVSLQPPPNPVRWVSFRNATILQVMICCTLVICQQATGVNAFLGYAATLFKNCGIEDPVQFNSIFNSIMVVIRKNTHTHTYIFFSTFFPPLLASEDFATFWHNICFFSKRCWFFTI